MIKVNLAAKKRANEAKSSSGGGGLSSFLSGLKLKASAPAEEGSPDRKGLVTGIVTAVVLAVGAQYFLSDFKQKKTDEVMADLNKLNSRLSFLDSEIAKTSGYEKTKAGLEADEKLIRTKLETIQKLLDDRTTPPKMLMMLTQALPKQVWLTSVTAEGPEIAIKGSSQGIDFVSDFMKSLEESIYFKDVTLKSSLQSKDKGVEVATFELLVKRR